MKTSGVTPVLFCRIYRCLFDVDKNKIFFHDTRTPRGEEQLNF